MRRMVVFALSLVLIGFLFEGALHSVHHLDDDQRAAECWLASAAGSVSIASPEPIVLHTVPVFVGAAIERDWPGSSDFSLDVGRGRAPPSALSA